MIKNDSLIKSMIVVVTSVTSAVAGKHEET